MARIRISIRHLLILFFVSYGLLIPVAATEFVASNFEASVAMIGCCLVIALMFWSRRAPLICIVLAIYVFQVYLTRPFVSVFEPYLNVQQAAYIESNNYFFNPDDAAIVFWSLLSLLTAWTVGLLCLRPVKYTKPLVFARVFTKIDNAIIEGGLPFWIAWALLFTLNYQNPGEGMRSGVTGEGTGSFLWGMVSLATIDVVCMYTFIQHRHLMARPARHLLLLPILVSTAYASLGGSRGAIFVAFVLALSYWVFLNMSSRNIKIGIGRGAIALMVTASFALVIVIVALFVQVLRPLYRQGAKPEDIATALTSESIVPASGNLFFGLTELLHRLSALKAPFLILSDRYVHDPWQYYNPIESLKRIINDLVPGDVFEGVLSINQLFDFIYHDTVVNYNSEMWSIQGTLYLYFGHWLAPIVVLCLGMMTYLMYPLIEKLARESPSFSAVLILLLYDLFNNGTVERVFRNDLVAPIVSLFIFFFLLRVIRLFLSSVGDRRNLVGTVRPQ